MLKIYDDEKGLITLHVDEKTARQVIEFAFLPICERDTIFQSEFEGYLTATEKMMDGWTDAHSDEIIGGVLIDEIPPSDEDTPPMYM